MLILRLLCLAAVAVASNDTNATVGVCCDGSAPSANGCCGDSNECPECCVVKAVAESGSSRTCTCTHCGAGAVMDPNYITSFTQMFPGFPLVDNPYSTMVSFTSSNTLVCPTAQCGGAFVGSRSYGGVGLTILMALFLSSSFWLGGARASTSLSAPEFGSSLEVEKNRFLRVVFCEGP